MYNDETLQFTTLFGSGFPYAYSQCDGYYRSLLLSIICYSKVPQNQYAQFYERATKVLGQRYVEEVDQEVLFQGAMNGDGNSG